MEKIVALCKRKAFIFPGSEIYGGLANSWDYGPYGVQLKKNIRDHWWKTFVQKRQDIVGLDSSIISNKEIWASSGHLERFYDIMIDNKDSKKRYRLDKLLAEHAPDINVDALTPAQQYQELLDRKIVCESSKTANWTEPKEFNLMLDTHLGPIKDESNLSYLRPETAQGIFINFKNILNSTRKQIPFGIAQIGKAFRNEITPGNFIFRTREFEQMEIEYFIEPMEKAELEKAFHQWKESCLEWLVKIGIDSSKLRFRDHEAEELSHYSDMTVDVEYQFPFGWGELMGLAYRGCFDLTQHHNHSSEKMEYSDPQSGKKYIPHVIEPSFGLDRTILTILIDAYDEEKVNDDTRVVMRFAPEIAPVKAAILPLMKKEPLVKLATEIKETLEEEIIVEYDQSGAIGKRYRRQDEIGTPYCITVDFDSLDDNSVTIRDRDSMEQKRVAISELPALLK